MRKTLMCVLATLALAAAGCRSLPPEKVTRGIHLLSEGIRDYVDHEQPAIETRIAALRDALAQTEDPAERAEIERLLAEEEEYLRLGREITPALRELEDWADGTPLPEQGGER
ncbi:MAG: hypothetical protein IT345_08705 [Trueperaceae bacterium]|nr:hypothetical protein [Trueperaceae bacterium]